MLLEELEATFAEVFPNGKKFVDNPLTWEFRAMAGQISLRNERHGLVLEYKVGREWNRDHLDDVTVPILDLLRDVKARMEHANVA